jgi:hypothetical protein
MFITAFIATPVKRITCNPAQSTVAGRLQLPP